GNKVRVQLQFRGREMAHQELGTHLVEKVRDDLSSMSQVETEPKIAGRNITMTLAPLPANRRKRKFTAPKALAENEETRGVTGPGFYAPPEAGVELGGA